jgi:hypothetical protein
MGWIVTSKNCSGLRRIFFVARQAMVMVWLTVSRTLTWARTPVSTSRCSAGERRAVIGSPPG